MCASHRWCSNSGIRPKPQNRDWITLSQRWWPLKFARSTLYSFAYSNRTNNVIISIAFRLSSTRIMHPYPINRTSVLDCAAYSHSLFILIDCPLYYLQKMSFKLLLHSFTSLLKDDSSTLTCLIILLDKTSLYDIILSYFHYSFSLGRRILYNISVKKKCLVPVGKVGYIQFVKLTRYLK